MQGKPQHVVDITSVKQRLPSCQRAPCCDDRCLWEYGVVGRSGCTTDQPVNISI